MQFLSTVIISLSVVLLAISFVSCQDGPAPPRLNIPGAIPLPLRPQFRNEKLPLLRVRRPIRIQPTNTIVPTIPPRSLEEAKPVTEEPEYDIGNTFIPQIISQQQHQQSQQHNSQSPPPANYYSEQNSIQQDSQPEEIHAQRFQERPTPQRQPQQAQVPIDFPNVSGGAQRFAVERQPRPTTNIVRNRPTAREPRPQFEQEQTIAVARPSIRANNIQPRPVDTNINHVHEQRNKKPVPQILKKYREEHEDGTITWGYENDDGSFKEEIIGTDCVTRGSYGYIDPDGNKREYNYETGIKCDPNKRDQPDESEAAGFVNYEQNKAVLPNGVQIDLSLMGKKKSKRPGAVLYQQPQQQFFRNSN